MATERLKIGELAARSGLTVRTLHHYDQIGLLRPSQRSAAGYRLYGIEEVRRLTQILSLRQVGLSLDEIRALLSGADASLPRTLELHAARLRERIDKLGSLLRRLEALATRARAAETLSVAELTDTMEMMTMYEKHFTPEQMETFAKQRAELGQETIEAAQREWPELIAAVRAEMHKGTDPADTEVQRLAARWRELVLAFTRGDAAVERGVAALYRQEPEMRQRTGIDAELMTYVGRAHEIAKGSDSGT